MYYKKECRITSLEDMNEGAAQKLYIHRNLLPTPLLISSEGINLH